MTETSHDEWIQKQFEAVHDKLDRLDEAIRGRPGNGSRPGIQVRLDRLEQNARRQSKLIWLIAGAVATATATGVVVWVTAGASAASGGG